MKWATYFGGYQKDEVGAVTFGENGEIYMSGITNSSDFPILNPELKSYFDVSVSSGANVITALDNDGIQPIQL